MVFNSPPQFGQCSWMPRRRGSRSGGPLTSRSEVTQTPNGSDAAVAWAPAPPVCAREPRPNHTSLSAMQVEPSSSTNTRRDWPARGAPRTKPYGLRPQARKDWRSEVHHYRQEAGAAVANKLVKAMAKALQNLARNPSIGLPAPPRPLCVDIDGLVGANYLGRRHHRAVAVWRLAVMPRASCRQPWPHRHRRSSSPGSPAHARCARSGNRRSRRHLWRSAVAPAEPDRRGPRRVPCCA